MKNVGCGTLMINSTNESLAVFGPVIGGTYTWIEVPVSGTPLLMLAQRNPRFRTALNGVVSVARFWIAVMAQTAAIFW
jgi:hypothetical protein